MLPGHAYLDVQFKGTSAKNLCDNIKWCSISLRFKWFYINLKLNLFKWFSNITTIDVQIDIYMTF